MKSEDQRFVNVLDWLGTASAAGELRSEIRVEVRAPVTLRYSRGDIPAETRDITPSGVCVISTWPGETGAEFTLELHSSHDQTTESPAAPILLRCRVCHQTPDGLGRFRIGARFI